MKIKIIKEAFALISISIIAAFIYNYFNGQGIPLVRNVEFASDSLINSLTSDSALLSSIDTSQKIIKFDELIDSSAKQTKNSEKIINDTSKTKFKADTSKHEPTLVPGKTLNITYEQTLKIMKMPNVIIYDARPKGLYEKGHLPNAVSLPPEEFEAKIMDLLTINKSYPVIIYCDGGECDLSHELETKLKAIGFQKLFIFQGGWEEWEKKQINR